MISYLLGALCVLPSLIAAGPLAKRGPTQACSGDCQGQVHDPSVVYDGQATYYRFTTDNEITIATAPSIAGPWTNQGAALPGGSSIDKPGRYDLWAPDVFLQDGTYYMYYSVSTIGSQNSDIGVATSPSMAVGTWTDHGSIGIPRDDSRWNRIDPNLFQHDANSPLYLSFGSFWENIWQVPMNDPPLSVAGSAIHLEQNPSNPAAEGSYQFWYPVEGTDYYYLFFSKGICCNTPSSPGGLPSENDAYKIMVCRSTSPTGGFVDQNGVDCLQGGGTLVYGSDSSNDVYAPGGQGVFYDPGQGSVVMYYHYVKPSVGYNSDQFQFGWNKLDFSSGWPVVAY
ncbi:hypothetical protein D0863_02631 [Hortaea werneckii]|uniref:Arabinan endo-1,5-alpha-L-arabinosidase n=1 Tax=Hortaea werneckii TaxID=91943 RepID=A0A3M7EFQ5_HORWE|nr:hypothetical protein D0863_02631 [Hortaea werneckii]